VCPASNPLAPKGKTANINNHKKPSIAMSSNLCLLRQMFQIQSLNQNVLQGTVFESVKGLSIEHVRFLIYPFSPREETTNINNH
jgi:hypothetical protein